MNKEELLKEIRKKEEKAIEDCPPGCWPRIWLTVEEAIVVLGLPKEKDKSPS